MLAALMSIALIWALLTVSVWAWLLWIGLETPLGHVAAILWLPRCWWPAEARYQVEQGERLQRLAKRLATSTGAED